MTLKKEKKQGRYLAGALPSLPFEDGNFELALCSHVLFLYEEHFSLEFHQQAILEMLRVAREVRVFPLLNLQGARSCFLEPVIESFRRDGFSVTVLKVPYEFQRGGNQMMKLSRSRPNEGFRWGERKKPAWKI